MVETPETSETNGGQYRWQECAVSIIAAAVFIIAEVAIIIPIAYMCIPNVVSVPRSVSIPILLIGLVALLGLSELFRQPPRFLTMRAIGIFLIATGILSGLPRLSSGLDWMAIPNSPERSLNVATAMVTAGLVSLSVYWGLNLWSSAGKHIKD
jgi:hypothetical protein